MKAVKGQRREKGALWDGNGDDGEERRSAAGESTPKGVQVRCRDQVPPGTAFPAGWVGATGWGRVPGPGPAPHSGSPQEPMLHKARPSGREQGRYRGGAPSQLDSALQRAASQSRAGPGGGAQSQGRVGVVGLQARPRCSRGRGAASQSAAVCARRDPERVTPPSTAPWRAPAPPLPGLRTRTRTALLGRPFQPRRTRGGSQV